MTLAVDPPAPPTLSGVDPAEHGDADVVADDDYRRDELESFMQEGAREEAFESWAAETTVDAAAWQIVVDLDLVSRFDLF
jgi:hypothetical protein